MRQTVAVVIALLIGLPAFGGTGFKLILDRSRTEYGPFDLRDGATIVLGKSAFVIDVLRHKKTLLERLGFMREASAPSFRLKSVKSGRRYGPFVLADRTKVTIGKATFTVKPVDLLFAKPAASPTSAGAQPSKPAAPSPKEGKVSVTMERGGPTMPKKARELKHPSSGGY